MQYRGEQITAIFRASSFQFKTYFIEKKGVLQGVERKFVGLNNGKNKFIKRNPRSLIVQMSLYVMNEYDHINHNKGYEYDSYDF